MTFTFIDILIGSGRLRVAVSFINENRHTHGVTAFGKQVVFSLYRQVVSLYVVVVVHNTFVNKEIGCV